MSNQVQNWRTETNATDYFGNQQKKLAVADRRPVIRKAADLVGPGIAANAVRITDFDNILATFNGFFSAAGDADNNPVPGDPMVGHVVSDAELGGYQSFADLTTGLIHFRVFNRNPLDASAIYFGDWAVITPA